jgi:hypothetical protein
MNAHVRQRLSRFSTDPVLGEDGKPTAVLSKDLTEYDIRALKTLVSRRVLNAEYIAALTGASVKGIRDRFNILKREPNQYVRVTAEQMNNQRQHLRSKLYYELGEAGITALEERGIKVPKRQRFKLLKHRVMIDEVMASWQIGFNANPKLTALWWPNIMASEKTPKKTLERPKPHQIPVEYPREKLTPCLLSYCRL